MDNVFVDYDIDKGINLLEVLSALSHALDIKETFELYCAALLKDSGCSSNASRVYKAFDSDDLKTKFNVKLIDWTNIIESFKFAINNTKPGANLFYKISHLLSETKGDPKLMDELTTIRCNKGFEIAISLGFSYNVANAIKFLDEHWDGNGSPYKIKGEKIPLFSRILSICQTFEVFASNFGLQAAFDIINKRKAKWFDPELVDLFNSFKNDNSVWERYYNFLENYNIVDLGKDLIDIDKNLNISTKQIAETFALIIDTKTPFTYNHSKRVADYCVLISNELGFENNRVEFMYVVGLLHDIGKLGVSNKILEKPGKLDDNEFEMIKLHPKYSYEILKNIKSFGYLANVAGSHHERLDGKGYYQALKEHQINEDMRILAVCDVFDALRSERLIS